MVTLKQQVTTKFGMKRSKKCYIRHDVIFNENDFGKTTDMSEQELEITEEPAKAIQIELPKQEEREQEESEGEMQPEPEPIRCSQRVSKKPIRYGIDEYADTASEASHVTYQAVKIEEPMQPLLKMHSVVATLKNGR